MYSVHLQQTTRLFGLLKKATTKHEVWFSEVSALDFFLYYDMAKVSSFFNGQEGRNFA